VPLAEQSWSITAALVSIFDSVKASRMVSSIQGRLYSDSFAVKQVQKGRGW
jgi:hypothetical protein